MLSDKVVFNLNPCFASSSARYLYMGALALPRVTPIFLIDPKINKFSDWVSIYRNAHKIHNIST